MDLLRQFKEDTALQLQQINSTESKPDIHTQNWDRIKSRVLEQYGEVVFKSWFKNITFLYYDSGTIFLSGQSRFIIDWVRTNYADFLLQSWRKIDPTVFFIDLILPKPSLKTIESSINSTKKAIENKSEKSPEEEKIRSIKARQFDLFYASENKVNHSLIADIKFEKSSNSRNKIDEIILGQTKKKKIDLHQTNAQYILEEARNKAKDDSTKENLVKKPIEESNELKEQQNELETSSFNQKLTFENFIRDESNNFAYLISQNFANNALKKNNMHGPLFLYGGVGLGKTHLMYSIFNQIAKNLKALNKNSWSKVLEQKVLYLPSERFVTEFLSALKNKALKAFKSQFRNVEILMIDDIQFFSGKGCTQDEFFNILNSFIIDGKLLVISSDKAPNMLKGLDEKIRSRLGCGLVIDIKPCTYELRFKILKRKSIQYGVSLDEKILKHLAHNIVTNVRELEGVVNKLVAISALNPKCLLNQESINENFSNFFYSTNLENKKLELNENISDNDNIVPRKIENKDQTLDVEKKNSLTYTQKPQLIRNNFNYKNFSSEKNNFSEIFLIQQKVSCYFGIQLGDMLSNIRSKHIVMPRQIAMFIAKKYTNFSLSEIANCFNCKAHSTILHAISKIDAALVDSVALSNDLNNILNTLQSKEVLYEKR
jgi:chromosomal replication initiator protein